MDIYKMNCGLKQNYNIIRILQEQIYKNKFNWQTVLLETIEELKNKKKTIIFIHNNNKHLYQNYIDYYNNKIKN